MDFRYAPTGSWAAWWRGEGRALAGGRGPAAQDVVERGLAFARRQHVERPLLPVRLVGGEALFDDAE
jgi:hypothetical protein